MRVDVAAHSTCRHRSTLFVLLNVGALDRLAAELTGGKLGRVHHPLTLCAKLNAHRHLTARWVWWGRGIIVRHERLG